MPLHPISVSTTPAACDACQKSIEANRGKLVVKEAARAVSERDDRLLSEKMEQLEAAHAEVCTGCGFGRETHPQCSAHLVAVTFSPGLG
jgi:hypothetical protein